MSKIAALQTTAAEPRRHSSLQQSRNRLQADGTPEETSPTVPRLWRRSRSQRIPTPAGHLRRAAMHPQGFGAAAGRLLGPGRKTPMSLAVASVEEAVAVPRAGDHASGRQRLRRRRGSLRVGGRNGRRLLQSITRVVYVKIWREAGYGDVPAVGSHSGCRPLELPSRHGQTEPGCPSFPGPGSNPGLPASRHRAFLNVARACRARHFGAPYRKAYPMHPRKRLLHEAIERAKPLAKRAAEGNVSASEEADLRRQVKQIED